MLLSCSDPINGNSGNNVISGHGGDDTISGGAGNDTLLGDAGGGSPTGIGMGNGYTTLAADAGNNSTATALDVTNKFSLAADGDIANATADPHTTISATGNGQAGYYSVTLNAGATIKLDIDGTSGVDSYVRIVDANGNVIASNDDAAGDLGSSGGTDSSLTFVVPANGKYTIIVGSYENNDSVPAGATYKLNISVPNFPGVPLDGVAGNDTLDGGAGDDLIDGGAGADRMIGGTGDDSFVVDNAGDVVVELAGEGIDTVNASVSFNMGAQHLENLVLTGTADIDGTGNSLDNTITGNAGANVLEGLGGNDTLNGGTGTDTLNGGAGNDTYVVDNTGDVVVELDGEGTDTVNASIAYVLGANLENLLLTGTGSINGTGNDGANVITGNSGANVITGNAGNNVLNGGAGADTLNGGAGNDTLDGGTGNDRMVGGAGDDIYWVREAGDRVVEATNEGTDTVNAFVNFALTSTAAIENLTLHGSGDISGSGNQLNNVISGNSGANLLVGLGGNDTFVFNTALSETNVDTIGDFTVGEDKLQLDDAIFSALTAGNLDASHFVANTTGLAGDADDHIIYDSANGVLLYDVDGAGGTDAVQFAFVGTDLNITASDFFVI